MDVLTEVKWLKTTQGAMTVREALTTPGVELSMEVPGFVYGAQFRFLLTVAALLVRRGGVAFTDAAVGKVCEELAPASDVFSPTNPFLQVSLGELLKLSLGEEAESFSLTDDEGKSDEELIAELREKAGLNRSTDVSKLYPHNLGPDDSPSLFWNLTPLSSRLSLEEAVLALVVFYFYGPGTNTYLLSGNRLKLTNGSSALHYQESLEIIPQGSDLRESLLLSLPNSFVQGEGLPHWADRACTFSTVLDPLWSFSWAANTVHCHWEGTELVGVVRGGVPPLWSHFMALAPGEKEWPKAYHDLRKTSDPLYLYKPNLKGELKLKTYSLSTDPYFTIAQWHAEQLTQELLAKWQKNVLDGSLLQNLVFLEHSTEGASSSFAIKYSKVVKGFRDELFPQNAVAMNLISDRYSEVLKMRGKLRGLFTEKGTCSHLANRQRDVENHFWGEMQDFTHSLIHEKLTDEEVEEEIVRRAVKAFEKTSSFRNTLHLKEHYAALRLIYSTFRRPHGQSK